MSETLQEYAREQLAASGERDAAKHAHAGWCLDLARTAESALWGPQQRAWLRLIDRELPNLRAALRWLVDNDGADQAAELAAALERFWLMRGHLAEGREWLETWLAAGGGTASARARRLGVASTLACYGGGDLERARAYADRARQAADECGDQEMLAQALCAAGQVARFGGDAGASRACSEEGVASLRARARPARLAEARPACAAGMLHAWADVGEMTQLAAEGLELSRAAGDTEGALCASCVLAHCLISVDDARAMALLEDVHETCRGDGTSRYKARGVCLQGVISLNKGEYTRGLAQLEEAAAITREFGQSGWLRSFCVPILARAHLLTGHPDEAARLLAAADREHAGTGEWTSRWLRAEDGGGIDATRAALADPRYDAAWAAGATLTVEQALDAARSVAAMAEREDEDELPDLTSRELEVLRLLTSDLSDAQIAQELVVSRRTVHAHLRSIYRKLDVGSRYAAAHWAREHCASDGAS